MSNWLIQLADRIASADFKLFMPDPNIDPENYSIDEMLDRLKSRNDSVSQDDGELVTRSDGTTAVKVRKRKRRTDQTKDKLKAHNQRIQLVQIAGFMIFLVALLFIGGGLILYSNSSVFYDDFITIDQCPGCSDASKFGYKDLMKKQGTCQSCEITLTVNLSSRVSKSDDLASASINANNWPMHTLVEFKSDSGIRRYRLDRSN